MGRGAKGPKWTSSEVDYHSYPEVRSLPETPSARALLDKLKLGLGGDSSPIPGVCFEWTGKLKDLLTPWWTEEDVQRCLGELEQHGLVYCDKAVPMIVVPLALHEEAARCRSFGTAVTWGAAVYSKLKVHPHSELLAQLDRALIRQLAGTHSFLASYLFREAYRTSIRKADTPADVETGEEVLLRLRANKKPAHPSPEWRLRERLLAAEYELGRPLELRRTRAPVAPPMAPAQEPPEDAPQWSRPIAEPLMGNADAAAPPPPLEPEQRRVLRECWERFTADGDVHDYLQLTLQHPTWSGLPDGRSGSTCSHADLERRWTDAVREGASAESWLHLADWIKTYRDGKGRRPFWWVNKKAPWMQLILALPQCIREATNYVTRREQIRTKARKAPADGRAEVNLSEAFRSAKQMFPGDIPGWLLEEALRAGLSEAKAREMWLPDVSEHARLEPPDSPGGGP